MKTTSLLALAACGGIIAAPIAIQFGRGDTNTPPKVTMPSPSSALDVDNPSLMHSKFMQVTSGAPLVFDMDAIAALKAPGNLAEINSQGRTLLEVSSNWFVYASGHLLGRFEGTNWIKMEIPDTNATMNLSFVQQALKQVWSEGSQFGIAAAIQNKTLVQMENAQELQKAAMFLRFGNQGGKR